MEQGRFSIIETLPWQMHCKHKAMWLMYNNLKDQQWIWCDFTTQISEYFSASMHFHAFLPEVWTVRGRCFPWNSINSREAEYWVPCKFQSFASCFCCFWPCNKYSDNELSRECNLRERRDFQTPWGKPDRWLADTGRSQSDCCSRKGFTEGIKHLSMLGMQIKVFRLRWAWVRFRRKFQRKKMWFTGTSNGSRILQVL